jgi:expansin (peptidoglycan-binding protein)
MARRGLLTPAPSWLGTWAGTDAGVVATRAGLQLWLQCGNSGDFSGPIQLDSLNQFSASGSLELSTGTFSGVIVGALYPDRLAVQWGIVQSPPTLANATYLLPDATGRPTHPEPQCDVGSPGASP